MQHAFQIVSRAPAPAGLSRHDFLESLLAVLIPFAYVVWKHSHPPMTGVLAALGCGAVFILGKFLFRHYAGRFHRDRPATLSVIDGCLHFTEGETTRWTVKTEELVGYDEANAHPPATHGVIRLHTATKHFAFPEHRFQRDDIAALLQAIGLTQART